MHAATHADAPSIVSQSNFTNRPPRWDVQVEMLITDEIGRELQAQLWNISEGGFAAECEERMRKGAIVEVELPMHGRVRAEVRWVLGWRFGALILRQG
jgi:hypothetical protein